MSKSSIEILQKQCLAEADELAKGLQVQGYKATVSPAYRTEERLCHEGIQWRFTMGLAKITVKKNGYTSRIHIDIEEHSANPDLNKFNVYTSRICRHTGYTRKVCLGLKGTLNKAVKLACKDVSVKENYRNLGKRKTKEVGHFYPVMKGQPGGRLFERSHAGICAHPCDNDNIEESAYKAVLARHPDLRPEQHTYKYELQTVTNDDGSSYDLHKIHIYRTDKSPAPINFGPMSQIFTNPGDWWFTVNFTHGSHETCHHCGGVGYNPHSIYRSCHKCGFGQQEVA